MKVKKFNKDLPDLKIDDKGDLIDLYVDSMCVCENSEMEINIAFNNLKTFPFVKVKAGEILVVGTGVAIELPYDKRADVASRSGTFKKYGLILTNGEGKIDNVYSGDNDEWKGVFYATRDTFVNRHERLLQFELVDRMRMPDIEYVDKLENADRCGYGSTGR